MTVTAKDHRYRYVIGQARQAIKQGNRRAARRWAEQAARLAPKQEAPWLIIAALATPRGSLEYLKHALEINPDSQHARKGMHWAIQRYRSEALHPQHIGTPVRVVSPPPETTRQKSTFLYPWIIIFLAVVAAAAVWFGTPSFSFASEESSQILMLAQELISNATKTPTITL